MHYRSDLNVVPSSVCTCKCVLSIHYTTSLQDVLVFVCMCKCVSYSAHKLHVSFIPSQKSLNSTFSTPVPPFCLIFTTSSELNYVFDLVPQ